jgi:hypothetical protein
MQALEEKLLSIRNQLTNFFLSFTTSNPAPNDENKTKCKICGKERLAEFEGIFFKEDGKELWACSYGHHPIISEIFK